MMDPMVVAAGLNVAGNLAGNLIGRGGGTPGGNMRNMREANTAAIMGKVRAAEKAGISKLYALGAPTVSPAVHVGGSPSLGETVSQMGADVSRAVAAGQTAAERSLTALSLEKAGLENDYLRAQIASVNMRTARESGPAFPVIPVTSNPLPGMGGARLGVQHPGLGQKAENDYSDIGGNIFGGSALVNDTVRDLEAWFRKSFPSMERLEPYLPFNIYK